MKGGKKIVYPKRKYLFDPYELDIWRQTNKLTSREWEFYSSKSKQTFWFLVLLLFAGMIVMGITSVYSISEHIDSDNTFIKSICDSFNLEFDDKDITCCNKLVSSYDYENANIKIMLSHDDCISPWLMFGDVDGKDRQIR